MSAAFRSLSSVAYAVRADTVISPPAGIEDGDVLILVHLIGDGNGHPPASATLPDGFQLLPGFPSTVNDTAGFYLTARIGYKVASGESGDYTVTHATEYSEALMFAVSGGMNAAPAVTINTGAGTTSTATGLTTSGGNSLVAFIAHNWSLYGSGEPPTGSSPTFTERFDSSANLTYLATGVLAAEGATGDKTQANLNNVGNYPWSAFLLEVRSAPPPFNPAWASNANQVIA
jgi:hypothetical protein